MHFSENAPTAGLKNASISQPRQASRAAPRRSLPNSAPISSRGLEAMRCSFRLFQNGPMGEGVRRLLA